MTQTESNLLIFVKVALGNRVPEPVYNTDWAQALEIATKQGIAGIVLDGINRCFEMNVPIDIDFKTKMEWIGLVSQMEASYKRHQVCMETLAEFYEKNGIRMMVLKGSGLSLNYPIAMLYSTDSLKRFLCQSLRIRRTDLC